MAHTRIPAENKEVIMATTPAAQPNMIYDPLHRGWCTSDAGILNLYWSFGQTNGTELDSVPTVIDSLDIAFLASFDWALPAIIAGLACLVIANMNAWKETDGY